MLREKCSYVWVQSSGFLKIVNIFTQMLVLLLKLSGCLSPEQVENEIRSDHNLLKGVSDARTNSHHFWEMWLLAVLNNLSIGCNCFRQIGRESSRTKLIRTISRERYKPGSRGRSLQGKVKFICQETMTTPSLRALPTPSQIPLPE